MDDNNNSYFRNYSGFEFVSRKGRGKKKNKFGTNRHSVFHSNEDTKSKTEISNAAESEMSNAAESEMSNAAESEMSDAAELEMSNAAETKMSNATESNFPEVSEIEDVDDESKNVVTYRAVVGRTLNGDSNRVSLDGMLKSLPVYETEVSVEKELGLLESSLDKLEIEDKIEYETPDAKFLEPNEHTVINTKALTKDATTYELEKFEKNALIIFNQEKIDGHHPRLGTEKDVESLTRSFENFGFEVEPHNDLTKDELFKELKAFSERDFTDYGCVAVAVLTHGSNNGLLRAKDQQYSEIEIINLFKEYNKPTLVTKPKVIIIQACRGTKIKQGQVVFQSGRIRKDLDEDLEPYILPVESDLLILHSSYPGSPAHRNELHGSWFIQALCKKIDTLASTDDLESILTEVKREVAIDKHHEEYNRRTFEMDINKQMPVMTSTLIRKLYLRKFGDQPQRETYVDKVKVQNDSRHEVLDTLSSAPVTPLLVQYGPCSCFLDHFNYMRNCLRLFVEDNPNDETAQNFLEVANTFEDGEQFNSSKEKMSKAISKHLLHHARSSQYYKYLYFYKHSQQPLIF